jgi:hypothetical protein
MDDDNETEISSPNVGLPKPASGPTDPNPSSLSMDDNQKTDAPSPNEVLPKPDVSPTDPKPSSRSGRPKTYKSPTASPWTIKGIEAETRSKVAAAAKRSKETLGIYVNRVLLEAANRDLSSKSRTEIGPTQEEINTQLLQRMDEISQRLEEVSQKPEVKHWLWKKIMR